jgi:hypothetical protein
MSHCSLLKAAHLEYLQVCRHFLQFVETELLKVASAPTVLAGKPLVVSGSSTMPCHSFSLALQKARLLALRLPALGSA